MARRRRAGFAQCLAGLRIARVELLPYHRIGAEKYKRLGMAYGFEDTPQPARAELDRFRGQVGAGRFTGENREAGGDRKSSEITRAQV